MTFIYPVENQTVQELTSERPFETKIGETIQLYDPNRTLEEQIRERNIRFVIIGIPEDIGPRANLGQPGAAHAWEPFLSKFLNMQSNRFLSGDKILLMGTVPCTDLMARAVGLDHTNPEDLETLRAMVEELDDRVATVAEAVAKCDVSLIVIGGGHNNCYGLLKGYATALNRPLNVINLDPHADFRPLEGRHSGNGFSYAREHGHLNQYYVAGLHESYNAEYALDLPFFAYDDHPRGQSFETMIQELQALGWSDLGLELDLDSIADMPTSAQSPSGYSVLEARRYIAACTAHYGPHYLHLPEGAPRLNGIEHLESW